MKPIVTGVASSCQFFCQPCKNGWTDRDAIWICDVNSGGSKEACTDGCTLASAGECDWTVHVHCAVVMRPYVKLLWPLVIIIVVNVLIRVTLSWICCSGNLWWQKLANLGLPENGHYSSSVCVFTATGNLLARHATCRLVCDYIKSCRLVCVFIINWCFMCCVCTLWFPFFSFCNSIIRIRTVAQNGCILNVRVAFVVLWMMFLLAKPINLLMQCFQPIHFVTQHATIL